jgi:hypothetical protein
MDGYASHGFCCKPLRLLLWSLEGLALIINLAVGLLADKNCEMAGGGCLTSVR